MRILIVSHLALPHVGGVESVVDLEIKALVAAGHSVTLVTSDGTGPVANPSYPPCVEIIRIPAWHVLEKRFGLPYPLFHPSLLSTLHEAVSNCDAVHVHGFMFLSSFVALTISKAAGKVSVLTDHGGFQDYGSRLTTTLARLGGETIGRVSSLLASEIVYFNARVGEALTRLARRKDAHFLPNPVDTSVFHPPMPEHRAELRKLLGWDSREPTVLFVGRLVAAKGIPMILESQQEGFRLAFCGPGDPSILGTLPSAGVEYLPPRPQSELRELYWAADVLVLPSLREGFPLVVQEAISCGLPAVLSRERGFLPYETTPGLYLCERSVEGVRTAIQLALRNGRDVIPVRSPFPDLPTWAERLVSIFQKARRA